MKSYLIQMPVCAMLRIALWAALGITFFASAPAMAWDQNPQGKDMGCSSTVANPCSGGSSGGGASSGGSSGGSGNSSGGGLGAGLIKGVENFLNLLGSSSDDKARQQHLNEAARLYKQGVDARDRGDMAAAAKYFQRALLNSPNDQNIRENLDKALAQLRIQQQAKAASFERERLVEE